MTRRPNPEPDDHRVGDAMPLARRRRRAHLVVASKVVLVVALLGAAAALALPSPAATVVGVATVVLVVGTPMARVAWLVVRWLRLGDRRFALVGLAVLALGVVAAVTPL
ncbi:MAG: hypothetical protein JJU45_00180 [Acidimicrobiia bacterium]|nr:hypothetical protein [Acidimicrobiia bacterium]